jgi:hypothetical protein
MSRTIAFVRDTRDRPRPHRGSGGRRRPERLLYARSKLTGDSEVAAPSWMEQPDGASRNRAGTRLVRLPPRVNARVSSLPTKDRAIACTEERGTDVSPTLRMVGTPGGQLHFELLASTKLLTELTTVDAALVTVAIWVAEGFAVSALTALVSASTEDLMALVWVGKSLLACVTTLSASVLILWNSASRALTPLLGLRLLTPLIEFSRSARAEQ